MGQEFRNGSAHCFWLRLSYKCGHQDVGWSFVMWNLDWLWGLCFRSPSRGCWQEALAPCHVGLSIVLTTEDSWLLPGRERKRARESDQSQKWHTVICSIFYQSCRPALVHCGRWLYKGVNTRRLGSLGNISEAGYLQSPAQRRNGRACGHRVPPGLQALVWSRYDYHHFSGEEAGPGR